MPETAATITAINLAKVQAQREGRTADDAMPVGPVGRAERPTGPADSAPAPEVGVIPVGQEPPRQPRLLDDGTPAPGGEPRQTGTPVGQPTTGKLKNKDRIIRPAIRNPEDFYNYKNRLDESRVFREETMRHLRRAELCVWLAIHGCQHDGAAQISQKRIAELAGIGAKRHVANAIKGLRAKGLLEVLSRGHYKPNGSSGHGLSSVYRVYPRPEPRLLQLATDHHACQDSQTSPDGVGGVPCGVVAPKKPASAKSTKTGKPR